MKFNVKKFVIWTAAVMAVSLMVTALVLVFTGGFSLASEDISQAKTFDLEEINEININTASTNINLIKSKDSQIQVSFYGEVSSSRGKPELEAYVSGNELNIDIIQAGGLYLGINILRTNLDIYIPDKIFDSVLVNTSSADLKIDGLSAKEFKLNNVSGDVIASSLIAESIELNTSSGKIMLGNYKGNLEVNSVSGDILIEKGSSNEDIKINTTSGDIRLEQEKTSNMELETVSGDINILLNKDSEFELKVTTISGNIENEFPIRLSSSADRKLEGEIGEGGESIIIDTNSGDISIGFND